MTKELNAENEGYASKLAALAGQTVDFRALVGVTILLGRWLQAGDPRILDPFTELDVFKVANDAISRVRVQNSWLYNTGQYQDPSSKELPPPLTKLSLPCRDQLTQLDGVLGSRSKYSFLGALVESTQFAAISHYIDTSRSTGAILGRRAVEYELFRVSLNCPTLAWPSKQQFFKAFPEYLERCYVTMEVGAAEQPSYDVLLDLGDVLDTAFCDASRLFFRGLETSKNRLVSKSAEALRNLAHIVRASSALDAQASNALSPFGVSSFAEAINLVLRSKHERVGALDYKIVLDSPKGGVWLVRLPLHEGCFLERVLPWTCDQYKADPLGFIQKHAGEISNCSHARWLLYNADVLQDLALEIGLGNLVGGLADAVVKSGHDIGTVTQQTILSARLQVVEKLNQITPELSAVQKKLVALIIAEILVDLAFLHETSIQETIRGVAVEMLVDMILAGLGAESN